MQNIAIINGDEATIKKAKKLDKQDKSKAENSIIKEVSR